MDDTLIEGLEAAAAAYERVIGGAEAMSPGAAAIAGAWVMTLHGHLFAAASRALRAQPGEKS